MRMQRDLPDDLKNADDIPHDFLGSLDSIHFCVDRLAESVARLRLAMTPGKEEPWPYGTRIDVCFADPRDGTPQWVRSRVADTQPGFVKIEFVYEDDGSKMWVRRDQCVRSVFPTRVSHE
jgi:hypothetical protein